MAPPHVIVPPSVVKLTEENKAEALEFLAARPLHTVFMASLIADNGIISRFNRGSFYGCRGRDGRLEGVALIGHATIIETENKQCIQTLAHVARNCSQLHMIRGEQREVESFWDYYSEGKRPARLLCRELLMELKQIPAGIEPISGLRQATLEDLEMVIDVNSSMAIDDSGVNPLMKDPEGFRERTARRISKGRIWLLSDRRPLFKADVVAETSKAIYLEGVYVDPQQRRKGYGLRCISQLAGLLLARTSSICLTVNENSSRNQGFYKRAGYQLASRYATIYPLEREQP